LRRLVWTNLVLGIWLMASPFALALLEARVYRVLWEDFLLGFGIAALSLCRLVSRRSEEIALSDWLMTAVGVLTFINPLLYNYHGITLATLNNLLIGAAVCLFAIYLDWKDSDRPT
jgi:hypothetical protein